MSNIIDKIQLSGVTYDIGGSGSVSTAITSGDTNAVAGGAVYDKFDEVEQVTAEALNDINDRVSEDEEVTAAALNTLNTNKQDKLSAGTGISISGNVISATGGGGGNPTVELTQAEYDALVTAGTVSADTYYIITDATPVDMSNYYTTAQTNTLLAGKQNTLVSGTNIKTINNESILGSGNISVEGKAIEAGRGISVATGATADTISVSLPISAGTGMDSIKENDNDNIASGQYSHAEGGLTIASGRHSHAEGFGTIATNESEHASGYFNVSNTGESISAQTLFSVGNGAFTARHNAFEIRQNGDIYLSSGGTDIKLQDHLGGGTVSSAITRGDTNAVAGGAVYDKFDEVEQVTAQALNVLNDRLNEDEEVTAAALNTLNEALSGKQDTLSAGTNITIVDNVISAEGGGGGKAVSGGTNISITTGETADTINCTLPITAGTGTNSLIVGYTSSDSYWRSQANGRGSIASGVRCFAKTNNSIAVGYNNTASGGATVNGNFAQGYMTTASGNRCHSEGLGTSSTADASHSEGHNTVASGNYSHSEGDEVNATNQCEHSQGRYNVSNKANTTWGDSGNTLFSVGNGISTSARHNAFEIRQNGDIYCSDGTNDVKLQDTITATSANTTALGGLKLVKLTQAQYDALATKDNSTLYVIVG